MDRPITAGQRWAADLFWLAVLVFAGWLAWLGFLLVDDWKNARDLAWKKSCVERGGVVTERQHWGPDCVGLKKF